MIESRTATSAGFEVRLHDSHGQIIAYGSLGTFEPSRMPALRPGENHVRCRFPGNALANGRYSVTLKLVLPFVETLDEVPNALAFDLELPPAAGASHRMLQAWGCGAFLLALDRTD
jgi:hypothetical protein